MKIKLINDNFTKDYAENYLKSKGIEDVAIEFCKQIQ